MTTIAAIGWKIVDRVGGLSPHGIGIAAGYVAGGTIGARRAEQLYGIKKDHIWNALIWAVVGVVVGARLFFVAGHLDDYFPDDPLGIFRVWEGGIVFYGGAIGGIVAAIPYLRKNGIGFWHAMDAVAPGFPLGLILGRIGDLIIGDHLGGRTDFFLGYRYEGGDLPPGCTVPGFDAQGGTIICPDIGEVVHQTALYDLLSVLVLFPFIMWFGRTRRADGLVFMVMASWYAVGRMVSDFARPAELYAGLRGTQWVSVAIIAFGLYWIPRALRAPASTKRYDEPEEEPFTPVGAVQAGDTAGERMIDEGAPASGGEAPHQPPEGSDEARMVDEGGPAHGPETHA